MDVTPSMDAAEAQGDAWTLSVDLGCAHVAAVITTRTGVPEPLELEGATVMPAGVWVDTHGRFVVGTAAMRRALLAPQRWQAAPVRLLGDGVEHTLDQAPFEPREAVAEILSNVLFAATDRLGRLPARTVLICPQPWPQARRDALAEAAGRAGMDDIEIVGSADAAAHYLYGAGMRTGQTVAVMDAGAGSVGTAVIRRSRDGLEVLSSDWSDGAGGHQIDLAIYERVVRSGLTLQDAALELQLMQPSNARWRRAREALLREVRRAREELTRYGTVRLNTDAVPGASLDLTRHDLDLLIRPQVDQMVHQLQRTLAASGVAADNLNGVALIGGTAATPLLARVIVAAIGQLPRLVPDAHLALAYGGATRALARLPVPAGHTGPSGGVTGPSSPLSPSSAVVVAPRLNDMSPADGIPIPPLSPPGGVQGPADGEESGDAADLLEELPEDPEEITEDTPEPEPLVPPEPDPEPEPEPLVPPDPEPEPEPLVPPEPDPEPEPLVAPEDEALPSTSPLAIPDPAALRPPGPPPRPVFQPPSPAHEPEDAPPSPSRVKRYAALLALTAVLVVLLGGVVALFRQAGDDPAAAPPPASASASAPSASSAGPSAAASSADDLWAGWKEDKDLAKAWSAVVPAQPGAVGSRGQTCEILRPDSPYSIHKILCTYPNQVRMTLFEYRTEADRDLREAQIAGVPGVLKQERDMRNLENTLIHGTLYEQPAQVWRWWVLDDEVRSAVYVSWPGHDASQLADWWDRFAPFT